MNGIKVARVTLFMAGVALFMAGCGRTPVRVASPPEIVRVPVYQPLPDDCAIQWPVKAPAGSSAADVMLEQREALDAYRDQVKRCFEVSNGGS